MVRRVLLISVAAGVLMSAAACGNSTPSSSVLLENAQSAYDSATSVKVSGIVQYKGNSFNIDLALSRSGDLSGTISTSIQTIKLIVVGGTAYQYVSKQFFNQLVQLQKEPASLCAVMCDKYLETPPSGQYSPFTLTSMISELNSAMPRVSSTVALTTFAGQPAYKLTASDGSKTYIASRGKHYLLGLTGSKAGQLTFSDWNTVPAIVAPPASQIADLAGTG